MPAPCCADAATGECSSNGSPRHGGADAVGADNPIPSGDLAGSGWTYDNPCNLTRTIHPSGEFAVIVTTGDERTARPEREPGPRHPKGYATELAVLTNGQLAFDFGAMPAAFVESRSIALCPRTWFLLLMSTRSVHAELSIPEGFADGRMTE